MNYCVANLKDMPADALDALIRDAEAERERRKVKPCVRRMDDKAISGLTIDGPEVCAVWRPQCEQLNIDHATAKRQIALAFCMADWVTRAGKFGLDIPPGHQRAWEFRWLVEELAGITQSEESIKAARDAGWIK